MSPAQKITTRGEFTAEKWVQKRVQRKQAAIHKLGTEETDGQMCRQTIAAQATNSSFRSNGNKAKDKVD